MSYVIPVLFWIILVFLITFISSFIYINDGFTNMATFSDLIEPYLFPVLILIGTLIVTGKKMMIDGIYERKANQEIVFFEFGQEENKKYMMSPRGLVPRNLENTDRTRKDFYSHLEDVMGFFNPFEDLDRASRNLKLVQLAFFVWYVNHHPAWAMDDLLTYQNYIQGASGGVKSILSTETQTKNVHFDNTVFFQNQFFKKYHDLDTKEGFIKLPVGMKLSFEKNNRLLRAENSYGSLEISFGNIESGNILQKGLQKSNRVIDKANARWGISVDKGFESRMNISFNYKETTSLRYSKIAKMQRDWINKLIDKFQNDVNWENFKSRI